MTPNLLVLGVTGAGERTERANLRRAVMLCEPDPTASNLSAPAVILISALAGPGCRARPVSRDACRRAARKNSGELRMRLRVSILHSTATTPSGEIPRFPPTYHSDCLVYSQLPWDLPHPNWQHGGRRD